MSNLDTFLKFNMFNILKRVSLSQILFRKYKVVKDTKSTLTFGRILCNSGCLTAGCCFSRQSDEEFLVKNPCKNNNGKPTNSKNQDVLSSNLEDEKDTLNSANMKRSFQCVVSQDANSDCSKSAFQISDEYSKRRKTDGYENTIEENSHLELSVVKSCDSSACNITEKSQAKKSNAEVEISKRYRPNYFVAVKISNDQIHQELRHLQSHILQRDDRLKKSMIDLKTLHITLMVMHIGDAATHARAIEALGNVHRELDEDMTKSPMKLEFQGLGHFQSRVLFAKLIRDDSYYRLCSLSECVKKHFASASIFTTDTRKDFNPHLTVGKIDFKKHQKRAFKKIDSSLYEDFNNHYFGAQQIESIQLLSMLDPKNEAGYYNGIEIYFSSYNSNVKINSLSKMLETEEKKQKVKERINTLMKEKLK